MPSFDCSLCDNVLTLSGGATRNKLNSLADSFPSKFPACPLTA